MLPCAAEASAGGKVSLYKLQRRDYSTCCSDCQDSIENEEKRSRPLRTASDEGKLI
ncbi:MAG: TRASH domain-containing protein [Eubacteriales bacterium]